MDCVGDRIVELNQPDLFLFGFIGAVEDRNAYLVGLVERHYPTLSARLWDTVAVPSKGSGEATCGISDIHHLAVRDKLIDARQAEFVASYS